MSSPHELAPCTRILVTVPLPLLFAARQRHSWFFESRTSRSRKPTAISLGVATVPPRAFWPDFTAAVAFSFLRSTRQTVLVEASSTNVAPSGPRTTALRSIGGLPSFGLSVYRSREL